MQSKNIFKYNTIIIIPAFNEEYTITSLVNTVKKYGTVVVVNDGSTDSTYKKAKSAGAIVVNAKHEGYDKALIKGFMKAKEISIKDKNIEEFVVVTMDADGQHDPNDIKYFVIPILNENIDMVLGYRNSFPRFSEVVMNYFYKKIFKVSDILCGMKSYKLSLINNNDINFLKSSIGTGLALNFLNNKFKWSFHNIKIKNRKDSNSRIGIIKGNIMILRALFISFIKILERKF